MIRAKLVKRTLSCPLCRGNKPIGRLCCRKCSTAYGDIQGNPELESIIMERESALQSADRMLHGILSEMAASA